MLQDWVGKNDIGKHVAILDQVDLVQGEMMVDHEDLVDVLAAHILVSIICIVCYGWLGHDSVSLGWIAKLTELKSAVWIDLATRIVF